MRSIFLFLLFLPLAGQGRGWYVNNHFGSDQGDGSEQKPFKTAQQAVNRSRSGDAVHLLPKGATYRQQISIRGKTNIVILGNGVTLTGADPLPASGWEAVGDRLWRKRMKQTLYNRHLLIRDGKAIRMGRSPSIRKEFPKPEQLKDGEFSWQAAEEKTGWLYVRGSLEDLEWSVRAAGVATSGASRGVTIRNLHARHALNDGYNIHGDCRGLICSDFTAYENFDEGFSAHDTCTAKVARARFWGNDHAVADVNFADTDYEDCEFRESLSTEVLFSGGKHTLRNCRIVASAPTAFSLSVGGHPKIEGKSLGQCHLVKCRIVSVDENKRAVRIAAECAAKFESCVLERLQLSNRGKITATECEMVGSRWSL
ncbi:MAG: hypothetical protein ACPGVU_06275 [Limisphaerales bacterium]